ncbi:hypothetical protein JL722_889 [Aureococcus anophagefferens]|nr:hypothetical protein JL722_889 [Aureococcus anophagefferens]
MLALLVVGADALSTTATSSHAAIGDLLRRTPGVSPDCAYDATPLQSGFCNDVFRVDVEHRPQPLVVKLFSDLARARCAPACRGVVDVAAGAAGLGPRVARADVLGHGDFKPSNVLLHDGAAVFIDFELAGPNYRGYDIFKLFRTNEMAPASDAELLRFIAVYLAEGGADSGDAEAARCLAESKLFEPLTWLEAAIFFEFAAAPRGCRRSATRCATSRGTAGPPTRPSPAPTSTGASPTSDGSSRPPPPRAALTSSLAEAEAEAEALVNW